MEQAHSAVKSANRQITVLSLQALAVSMALHEARNNNLQGEPSCILLDAALQERLTWLEQDYATQGEKPEAVQLSLEQTKECAAYEAEVSFHHRRLNVSNLIVKALLCTEQLDPFQ